MAIAQNAIENFKRTFTIHTDIKDIKFVGLSEEAYNSPNQKHEFGEKLSLLYNVDLNMFNAEVNLRILCLKYVSNSFVIIPLFHSENF